MTISGITPAAGTTLAGTSTPFSFSSDKAISFINVNYGASGFLEDVAFRDGAFQGPFAGLSTKVGNVYTLRRNGGWPAEPTPVVEEKSASAGAQPWGTIYDVDLTAQSAQTFTAGGSYTIDGKTWWAKAALPSGTVDCSLAAGTGLRIAYGSSMFASEWRSNAVFNGRVFAMPLAQIDGYNPLSPLAVIARITSPNGWTNDGQKNACVGIGNVALSSANVLATEKAATTVVSNYAQSAAWFIRNAQGNIVDSIGPSTAGITNIGNVVQGVLRFATSRVYPLVGLFSANPDLGDDPNSLNIYTAFPVAGTADGGTSNASLLFFVNQAFTGTAQDYALARVKIMQPKVP